MRPLARRASFALVGAVALLVAVTAVAKVRAGDRPTAATTVDAASVPYGAPPAGATPTRYTGPQGTVGQFVVTCRYTHSGPHDPIVHPGHAGASHRHDFYGATSTTFSSTIAELRRSPTTCNKSVDTAAYWQPTLYDHGEVVAPVELTAYYRPGPGVDGADVVTMPQGLALITGDRTATVAQPGDATGWTCGSATIIRDDPPTCPSGAPLHLVLTFQDCWDGVHVDSPDHDLHATYSHDGRCPDGFGVHIPQLTLSIKFPIWGTGHDLSLASGNIYSAHGDFWNAWDPAGLQREVRSCINRGAVCDLASNREEEALFSYTS